MISLCCAAFYDSEVGAVLCFAVFVDISDVFREWYQSMLLYIIQIGDGAENQLRTVAENLPFLNLKRAGVRTTVHCD